MNQAGLPSNKYILGRGFSSVDMHIVSPRISSGLIKVYIAYCAQTKWDEKSTYVVAKDTHDARADNDSK